MTRDDRKELITQGAIVVACAVLGWLVGRL